MTGFAADVFKRPKKATLAIVSAISAAGPSGTPVKKEWHGPCPLRCLESAAFDYYVVAMCGRYASFLPAEAIAKVSAR
jgi:hypothetical protein